MEDSKKQSNYLKGASILTATMIITKIIGAIYKIPIYNLLGDEGTTHFQVTYTIYNLLLTLSTAGIPVALARLISAAKALDRPNQIRRYYSVSYWTFMIVGIIGSVSMFIYAQPLADFMNDSEVAIGVRALAPAVFFACLVSVYRGYSQGYNDMLPTAISQILEVVCKLVFGLAIAWYLSSRGFGLATVSAGAIVGVTIGLGLAVPVLAVLRRKLVKKFASNAQSDVPKTVLSTFWELMRVSIPIMLGSSVLNIISLIDTKLILSRLEFGAGFTKIEREVLYGVNSKALPLFSLPTAIITPISVAIVPVIAAAIARKQRDEARGIMESSMKLTNLIAMPAAAGMCVLSYPIFQALFPNSNEKGPAILAILAIASFFVCSYVITSAVLQARGFEKVSLISLPVGGIIMIVLDYMLVGIRSINILGSPIGTLACYFVITLINISVMAFKVPERPNLLKITVRPAVCTALMAVAAVAVYGLMEKFCFVPLGGGVWAYRLCLAVAIVVAVAVYAVLIISLRAVTREDVLLLPKGEKIANFLHIH